MENTSRIYDALVTLLGQSKQWADVRHLYTLVWMVIGLIHSGRVNLSKWTMYIHSRAVFAQSKQRRFSRWLHNPRIVLQKREILTLAISNTLCKILCNTFANKVA